MPLRGLTVNSRGQLLRDGQRFRNIGLNYGGAVVPIYTQPSATACAYTTSAEQDAYLDLAQSMGVRVLRVKATPYWPAQWRYGVNGGVAGVAAIAADREAHYVKMDQFVAKCRSRDIGIIWNIFFRHVSVSDLAGQTPRTAWTAGGATRTYAQALTQEIVTRYLTEDAVLGYEWSNEVNHYNDALDAAMGNYPGVNVGLGSQASYPASTTNFVGTELQSVLQWWYGVVSAIDNQRIVLSGNGSNSFSQPGGTPGISFPLVNWYREQVRDNPTNCASIHFYGNINYGSANLRGLNALLTGVRHHQRIAGRGFVLGEFGNQPATVTAASVSGGVVTFTMSSATTLEAGDPFQISGVPGFNGSYTANTVDAARTSITASTTNTGTFSGSGRMQQMSGERLSRMCADIIDSDTDVACFWMIDGDPGRPAWESLDFPGNESLIAAITAANRRLGW